MILIHGPEANHQEFFDQLNLERFNKAEVCERCKKRPPAEIMRYTNYCAVCRECADELLTDLRECQEELSRREE